MKIILNHQIEEVAEQACLHDIVLERLGEKQQGIAVAVNNIVIPRHARTQYVLQPNDNILIIQATQGG
ncbi:sulfur carrier protein ThiS [Chitinophaga costaii]|uniref:Sulfur carrier protein ThiS n=1 Tax=Chitinophaga costaii TaxID=1335309 RepID=A0A1C4FMG2_9BACT|nr:sulfur carrier protein ThiS [Chitinophaga costaii]PUZ29962.1 thiamine biosynthesis protein ThiS [Chitinophaga costaii]SCC56843.1 sulfur carrier protein ThiS [Chitinophaga costaii]